MLNIRALILKQKSNARSLYQTVCLPAKRKLLECLPLILNWSNVLYHKSIAFILGWHFVTILLLHLWACCNPRSLGWPLRISETIHAWGGKHHRGNLAYSFRIPMILNRAGGWKNRISLKDTYHGHKTFFWSVFFKPPTFRSCLHFPLTESKLVYKGMSVKNRHSLSVIRNKQAAYRFS